MEEQPPKYRLTSQTIQDGAYTITVPANYEVWRDGVYERIIAEFTGAEPWPVPSMDSESPWEHRQNHLKRLTHFPIWTGRTGYRLDDKVVRDVVVKTNFALPDETVRTLWLPASVLADANKLKTLSDFGADVNSINAGALVLYFAALRGKNRELPMARVVRRVGYYPIDGEHAWLCGAQWIGPESTVEVDNQAHTALMRAYAPSKSTDDEAAYKEWRDFCVSYLYDEQGGRLTRWLFGQAFLPPIAPIIGQRGMIAHLYGESGHGKSALSSLAMTAFGDPREGHLYQGLNKTQNAILEMFETQVSDFPLLLDELQVTDARFNKSQLIYSLVLGQGKARVDSHGVRLGSADAKFRAIVQMTGEQPLIDKDLGGQVNRVIEIEMTRAMIPEKDRVRAIYSFERERRIWGLAGPRFLQTLRGHLRTPDQHDQFMGRYRDMKDVLREHITHNGSWDMLASVAFAEYLMLRFVFGADYDKQDAWQTAVDDAVWIYQQAIEPQQRDQTRPLWLRTLDVLREHLAGNPNMYPNLDTQEGQEAAKRGTAGRGFAGFMSGTEMIYLPAAFDRICFDAFGSSGKRAVSELVENGVARGSGKFKRIERSRRPWIPTARYIVLSLEALLEKPEPVRVNSVALASWDPEAEY